MNTFVKYCLFPCVNTVFFILFTLTFMKKFDVYLGTMSGGGKTVLRGRMGQCVAVTSVATPRKLDQMEQKLQHLESRARQLCTRQVSLEDQVSLLSQQLQGMRMNFNKFKMEIQVCSFL
jgi:chromosome segregation ATPase